MQQHTQKKPKRSNKRKTPKRSNKQRKRSNKRRTPKRSNKRKTPKRSNKRKTPKRSTKNTKTKAFGGNDDDLSKLKSSLEKNILKLMSDYLNTRASFEIFNEDLLKATKLRTKLRSAHDFNKIFLLITTFIDNANTNTKFKHNVREHIMTYLKKSKGIPTQTRIEILAKMSEFDNKKNKPTPKHKTKYF